MRGFTFAFAAANVEFHLNIDGFAARDGNDLKINPRVSFQNLIHYSDERFVKFFQLYTYLGSNFG